MQAAAAQLIMLRQAKTAPHLTQTGRCCPALQPPHDAPAPAPPRLHATLQSSRPARLRTAGPPRQGGGGGILLTFAERSAAVFVDESLDWGFQAMHQTFLHGLHCRRPLRVPFPQPTALRLPPPPSGCRPGALALRAPIAGNCRSKSAASCDPRSARRSPSRPGVAISPGCRHLARVGLRRPSKRFRVCTRGQWRGTRGERAPQAVGGRARSCHARLTRQGPQIAE